MLSTYESANEPRNSPCSICNAPLIVVYVSPLVAFGIIKLLFIFALFLSSTYGVVLVLNCVS